MKSPLKWWGGKSRLAPWIVSQMPEHTQYVETHGGSLAVLFAKPPGAAEVVNDVNLSLTSFWMVLRTENLFEEFKRKIQATPFSRIEWDKPEPEDIVDHAVWFFTRHRQSRSGAGKCFAPLTKTRTRGGIHADANAWWKAVDGLDKVYERLRGVVIECVDACRLIERLDTPDTLFYIDPPYHPDTRTCKRMYEDEMSSYAHLTLMHVLSKVRGKVMLSGYAHASYPKWRMLTKDVQKASGKGRVQECLWLNF